MSLVHFPAWSNANIGITVLQAFGFGGCFSELQGNNAGYSKFADPKKSFKVSSRLGMLLLYSPAFAVSLKYLQSSPLAIGNGREKITASLLALHFGKRVFEVMCVHQYSGTMDGDFLVPISASYALTAALIAHQQRQIEAYTHPLAKVSLGVGVGLALLGQLGNLYHHILLSKLRAGKSASERYVIPVGGLFRYVTMPHYFCELVSWLGLACVTQQLNAFLTVADMLSYLGGRSVATTRWYKSKFADYPSERKHLIPFLF
eukprot:TRINITY_DN32136_c0_g1_i1.p1 TRINITY_DN32136_c0_g1~~TRINITY_DN32136_c0_g1_i1.p1  ORF type:complete len:260 (+),score=23.07 TRINITY_DN32136_c0_g1_i1:53-832(+)